MKSYTIKKGKHRASPMMLGVWLNKHSVSYRVSFDGSCKYRLNTEDQLDINKLFGIGYLPSHHKESARFGWRYNPDIDKIELFAYCYVSGERIAVKICNCSFYRSYDLRLDIDFGIYGFVVKKDGEEFVKEINYYHSKAFGFALGVYFGGNNPAPHHIEINLRKL